MPLSLIKTFQDILASTDLSRFSPEECDGIHKAFPKKRFLKKFEVPDSSAAQLRKERTFLNWVSYDESLKTVNLPHYAWYRARLKIQKILRDFRPGELAFTGGSQSTPLHGRQSVADKLLTHDWEISPDCVSLFLRLGEKDQAIVRAAKIRMRNSMSKTAYRKIVWRIYSINQSASDVRKYIIAWNLTEREASRFSTVAKNNDIDRSIDLQPFCNMLVQRAIGLGLREIIRKEFSVDLENAQHVHGRMITDMEYATVDLKNASDSVTWSLVDFLCTARFGHLLRCATPLYVEGLDGMYYITKKVSSMGNGFTFELMTLFLLACARELDETSSVYGDDIVIKTSVADNFISALTSVGFVTNVDKTFLTGPFRESCGYNYDNDSKSYIRSFDFVYPTTIGNCITFFNKLVLLREIDCFKELHDRLLRAVPNALRGPIPMGMEIGPVLDDDLGELSSYFWVKPKALRLSPPEPSLSSACEKINFTQVGTHRGYLFRAKVFTHRRPDISMKRNARLYFAYMQAGRVTDIVLTGRGEWVSVLYVSDGLRSIRAKNLVD